MNLLGAVNYDPGTAVSKATSALLAMTAFDTTNLRLAITVPSHGIVRFRLRCTITGATTLPTILLGVLNSTTVVGRVAPVIFPGTMNAATQQSTADAEFTVTGLTPGATNFDAAYAVQVVVASTNIKYGGPNNTTGANAWGAFTFEAWDPRPLTTGLAGGVNVTQWNGTNVSTPSTAGIPEVNIKNIANAAVSTSSAQIGVNVVNAGGTAWGSGAITAGSIAASALNGKGDWLLSSSYTAPPAASAVATAVWQDTTAGDFTVASSIGKSLYTSGNAPGAASGLAIVGSNMGSVASVSGAVGSVTGAVGSVTGNVGGNVVGSVGSVTGAVGSVTAAVTVGTNNDKTGYALTAAYDAAKTALPASSYVAPDNTSIATILTRTDVATSTRLASASYTTPPTTAAIASAVFDTPMTESYNAKAAPASLAQVGYTLLAQMGETAIIDVTKTLYKIDGITVAKTYTLNSATNPTAITRAT